MNTPSCPKYEYSKSELEIIIARYFWLFIIIGGIFSLLLGLIHSEYHIKDGVFQLCLFIFVVCLIVSLYFRKIPSRSIRKLVIDFENDRITFYTIHKKDPFQFNFSALKKIYVTGYINFVFEDHSFYLNEPGQRGLLIHLNQVKKIIWGPDWFVWGPPKKIKDEIDLINSKQL